MPMTDRYDENLMPCIEMCTDCHQACLRTIPYCLQKGGPHAQFEHIRLLEDCVQICQTSADFMLRSSDLHTITCGACAEICDRCADDCMRMPDPHMEACGEVCRKCAEMCRQMAHQMSH